MKHLSIIRSLDSKEGNHDRGTYMMHTGYAPNPTVVHPGFGSVCAVRAGRAARELRPAALHLDQLARAPGPASSGCRTPRSWSRTRTRRSPTSSRPRTSTTGGWTAGSRCSARSRTTSSRQRRGQAAVDHKAVYAKTLRMMNSQLPSAFKLDDEPAAVRDAYGQGSFGSGCLMARRLVEQGVTFVEVSLGGWDTHANTFDTLSQPAPPRARQGDGGPGRRPGPARPARHHD